MSGDFVSDAVRHDLAEKLSISFLQHFDYRPGLAEVNAWRNSLHDLAFQLERAKLRDNGIILEMHLPLNSARLDCLLTGTDEQRRPQAVVVELKQWQDAERSEVSECVETFVGGAKRRLPHPSVQVRSYAQYLSDYNMAFHDETDPIALSACSYLHNFKAHQTSPLLDPKFEAVLTEYPLFGANETQAFATYLATRLERGKGRPVLDRVLGGKIRASKKLMQHTADIIARNPAYTLLDDQIVAYNSVLTFAKAGVRSKKKTVVIVPGGPGTGKSLIALNLLAELSKLEIFSQHATGSRAFTENLRSAVGRRAAQQFRYFNNFVEAGEDAIEVLILDEAHRIRDTSNNRFTPRDARSELSQIEELLRSSRVCVFFLDENQMVRPDEVGTVKLIQNAAKARGARLEILPPLQTQFRCAGSDAFVSWIDATLGIAPAEPKFAPTADFEFAVTDSPLELEAMVQSKIAAGNTARVTAGFCWPWSKSLDDGTLLNDVRIGDYQRPWNARPESKRFAIDVPPSNFWATDPRGANQIGCIYTAQGFEFDYVGVIFGRDLYFDESQGKWIGRKEFSRDNFVKRGARDDYLKYAQHVYRVLLTRGMKGCFVYFMDLETRRHFERAIADRE